MAYADYEWYKNYFLGNAIEEKDFPRLAVRASAYLDSVTGGKAKTATGATLEAVKNATCELAEVFQDEEKMRRVAYSTTGNVASETVGSWSRSYGSKSVSSVDVSMAEKRKRDAVLIYLTGTGLIGFEGQPMKKGWFP